MQRPATPRQALHLLKRMCLKGLGNVMAYLLAILALLGGGAFQMRNGGGLSPQLYAVMQMHSDQQASSGHNAAAQAEATGSFCGQQRFPSAAAPASQPTHQPRQMPMPLGHSNSHQSNSAQSRLNKNSPERNNASKHAAHDHSAHCPFCVTQAFASDVGQFELPTVPLDYLPTLMPQPLHVWLAAPRHADARAPPQATARYAPKLG